jgi:Bacterial Ig domain
MRFSFFSRKRTMQKPLRTRLQLEQLEDRSMPSINVGASFDGLDFASTADGAPPDTIAAAGPDYFIEMVNTDMAIYTKTGTKVFQQDLSQFFSSVRTGNALSDPVVVYDEQAGRFMVGVLDLSLSFFGTVNGDSFLYAVSDSANPTLDSTGDGKAFTEMHAINLTENVPAGTVWADYPRIGWNADGYYVTFNMFTTGFFNTYDHASVISIDKATAIDANNSSFTFTHTNMPGGITQATLAPATMHGSTASTPGSPQPMYFVEEKLDSNGNATGSAIRVVTATNLLTGSPTLQFTDLTVASYQPPPPATQQGSTTLMSTNDSRMLNAEWRNNRLVASHTVGVNTDSQSHARWYEFNTSGAPTLIQQGTIGLGSGAYSYFPSIAIDPNGDLGMTFMQSSSTEYVSMYVTGQSPGDPIGAMQAPVLVKAGQTAYSATFDSSPYRAGDYSGITVDPTDGSFWAANEYAKAIASSANWGTWLANFTLGAAGPDVTPPTAILTAPNGGETWTAGTTRIIAWTATDNVGVTAVDLYYSTDGGDNFTTIATGLANSGTYAWAVPNTPTPTAVVRVVAYDLAGNSGFDVSNATFTIAAPDTSAPTVTVTSPNGGESWAAGSVHNITWTATDDVGVTSVDLFYSTDGGNNFTTIATGLANTGSYAWTVPNAPTINGFVKVVAHDGSGNTGQDLSNAAFTISAPVGNPNEIYVWDMAWSASRRGNWITISVTLFVKRDSDGDGIAEATDAAAGGVLTTLVMDHYLSGILLSSTTFANAKTNGNGQVTLNLKTQYDGDFHAQVTSMSKAGLTWDMGLDQNNPSCFNYNGATGVGQEENCSEIIPVMEPLRVLTSTRTTTSETPPMLANGGGPTLPEAAFQSESPLFEQDELVVIGNPAGRGKVRS